MVSVRFNYLRVKMLYDPGTAYSVIGENLGSPALVHTENLTAYKEVKIETLGKTFVNVNAFSSSKKLQLP